MDSYASLLDSPSAHFWSCYRPSSHRWSEGWSGMQHHHHPLVLTSDLCQNCKQQKKKKLSKNVALLTKLIQFSFVYVLHHWQEIVPMGIWGNFTLEEQNQSSSQSSSDWCWTDFSLWWAKIIKVKKWKWKWNDES